MTESTRRHGYLYDDAGRQNSLILIERMQREDASPREIERAMTESTNQGQPARTSRSRPLRRARRLLRTRG
jgi:hypothetical protein